MGSSVVSFDVRVQTRTKKSPPVTCNPLTLSVKLGADSWRPGVSEKLAWTEKNDIRDPSFLSKLLLAKTRMDIAQAEGNV